MEQVNATKTSDTDATAAAYKRFTATRTGRISAHVPFDDIWQYYRDRVEPKWRTARALNPENRVAHNVLPLL